MSLDSSGPNSKFSWGDYDWLSLRQVPALGQSVRPDAVQSQLLPLWPDRPGKKGTVHYPGLQQKP